MPVFDPEPKIIQVRGDHIMGSKLLFEYYPQAMEMKLKYRSAIFTIKIKDLLVFANETDEDIFHVKAIIEDNDEV